MENTFLSGLEWRNAEKNFDPSKKVSPEDLEKILHAIKLAPSSFGIQPYHVFAVSDRTVKLKLKEKGFNQQQFEDASHILVFCGRNDIFDRIDEYFKIATDGDEEKRKEMAGYESMMKGFAEGQTEQVAMQWAFRQAYIALGFALAACAELRIDSCPMEGFDSHGFDQVLNLSDNMRSVAVMSIGYRKEEPHRPKVRFPEEDLFTMI